MKFTAIKTFPNMPCAHQQWFDEDDTGEMFSGSCAKFHGYDRSVELTIEGEIDAHGWVFPFGHFKKVRKFLEYYFDHTAVIGADDPRLAGTLEFNKHAKIFNLRVLPFGVSMEMSSLFVWVWVNAYVHRVTDGRCVVTKVVSREHEKNAAAIEFSMWEAQAAAIKANEGKEPMILPEIDVWPFCAPQDMTTTVRNIVGSATDDQVMNLLLEL